ncbi:MAG: D-alanyl-D-alanine carboxypeptidase family protein [Patescibacteria group bacterium]|nr:D-alanyl-D-alanine carboxypeptidase family protein [Patescibacteria group bacterium]
MKTRKIKNYNWINYLSILSIICSITVWYYLLPNFISAKDFTKNEDSIHVEGAFEGKKAAANTKTQTKEDIKQMTAAKNSISGELYKVKPDAPIKKESSPGDMYVRARSAIAIDANSGTILHYQDGKRKAAIASLTKIMTAILVVEKIDDLESEVVTMDQESILVDGTKVGCPRSGYCVSTRLQVGEKVLAKHLFEAMLMNSANDAAVMLGRHIAGSQEKFADMMNDKANELGLKDTHFCNPSGLDDEDNPGTCYSTAYDIARVAAYSLRYDKIWNAMKMKEKDFCSQDGLYTHHVFNTDVLLEQLPNCLGGKTGFTYEAGKSLMSVAHHPNDKNRKVIAVLLDDNYRWDDMKNLFGWVFSVYTWPR